MATTFSGALAQGFSFGVKAGLNFAKEVVNGSGVTINTDNITSFHGGVYAKIMFIPNFGIQPELLYSGQGGTVSSGGITSTDKFSYLNIPVMLRYNIVPAFNLQAGPQLGFLLSATSNGTDVKSQLKSTDFGLGFGLGVDLPMGLNFAARYVLGLSDLPATNSTSATIKNTVFQISIGYKLFGI